MPSKVTKAKAPLAYKIVIGNYNYSSWSMRVWLFMRLSGFSEGDGTLEVVRIPIYTDNYKEKLLKHSPAGRVPVLVIPPDGTNETITVWDSLAIMEYIREQHPDEAVGWPKGSPQAGLTARSIAYEMHSSFLNIRDELAQNLRRRNTLDPLTDLTADCRKQIQRVNDIWTSCRKQYASQSDNNGPWLFGTEQPTIADIMYIPVALRLVTYGLVTDCLLSPEAIAYVKTVQENKLVQDWVAWAKEEEESIDFIDQRVPASQSPLNL